MTLEWLCRPRCRLSGVCCPCGRRGTATDLPTASESSARSTSATMATKFNLKHQLEFGLLVSERNPANKAVVSVDCLFCRHVGREEQEEQEDEENEDPEGDDARPVKRRKKTTKNKSWTGPSWRPSNYATHHKTQHAIAWTEYQALSPEEQKLYFSSKKPIQTTLHRYMELDADKLIFPISAPVVEGIIGDLMFRAEDELAADMVDAEDIDHDPNPARLAAKIAKTKKSAMKLFVPNDDGSYVVTVKNVMRFQLAIDHVFTGMSFRQTAAAIESARTRTNVAKLQGVSDHMVGMFVRILVAICLQKFSDLLATADVWAFSIGFDGSTHRGTSFFDVRMRICVLGVLFNVHLIALPMFHRHTSDNYVTLLVKLLTALYEHWRDKLIGISTDGENTNTGRLRGIVTQLVAMATNKVRLVLLCSMHSLVIRRP